MNYVDFKYAKQTENNQIYIMSMLCIPLLFLHFYSHILNYAKMRSQFGHLKHQQRIHLNVCQVADDGTIDLSVKRIHKN